MNKKRKPWLGCIPLKSKNNNSRNNSSNSIRGNRVTLHLDTTSNNTTHLKVWHLQLDCHLATPTATMPPSSNTNKEAYHHHSHLQTLSTLPLITKELIDRVEGMGGMGLNPLRRGLVQGAGHLVGMANKAPLPLLGNNSNSNGMGLVNTLVAGMELLLLLLLLVLPQDSNNKVGMVNSNKALRPRLISSSRGLEGSLAGVVIKESAFLFGAFALFLCIKS